MAGTVDVACVVHLHSVHSDGTGTVDQIAAAARRAGVDVVLLTDHDTLEARRRGEEGWHGPVLVCVGTEVSPLGHDHYLAFGLEREVDLRGLDAHQLGLRIAGRVPLRLMAYRRSFSFLRTHLLLDRPFTGDADRDRDAVYAALRAGRCYLAMDRLAPAEGFAFGGDGVAM